MKALFIGSFNPPTKAHLEMALISSSNFDEVIFVPVNTNDKNLLNIKMRIDMLNIYTHKYSNLKIDNIMEKYSYFNYRILDILSKKYKTNNIIVGSDLLNKFNNFDNCDYLFSNYIFYVFTRGLINKDFKKYKKNIKIIKYDNDISSTIARKYIKNNLDTKDILDSEIDLYIKKNHLYF